MSSINNSQRHGMVSSSSETSIPTMRNRYDNVRQSTATHSETSSIVSQTRSMMGNDTIANLPGLALGSKLGLLVTGYLEKRRDGAVRGGWAKRFFVLTTNGIYYYRKQYSYELFGEERGRIRLVDIKRVFLVSKEELPFGAVEQGFDYFFIAIEMNNTRSILLRIPDHSFAEDWVKVIGAALKVSKQHNYPEEWDKSMKAMYITLLNGDDDKLPLPVSDIELVKTPHLILISLFEPICSDQFVEQVMSHSPELNTLIYIGSCTPNGSLILTFSSGQNIRLPYTVLKQRALRGKHFHASLPKNQEYTSVQMTLRLESKRIVPNPKRSQAEMASSLNDRHEDYKSPTWIMAMRKDSNLCLGFIDGAHAIPLLLSFLFLCCFFVTYYYDLGFGGLTLQLALINGFLLALLQILQYCFHMFSLFRKKSPSERETKTDSNKNNAQPISEKKEAEFEFWLQIIEIKAAYDNDGGENDDSNTADVVENQENKENITDEQQNEEELMPERFIAAEKGNVEKAKERWKKTCEWRLENRMSTILIRPHRNFDTIKRFYPQYFHGRSKANYPVYYEIPGHIDLNGLKNANLSMDDLLYHYMYITEYLWKYIEPTETGRSITILDVSGIGLSDVGGEIMDFIRKASQFTGLYYPERSAHIYIINISTMFSLIWNMVKGLIDPVTREKVHMVRNRYILSELEKHIDISQIPKDYGGKGVALGESEEEALLSAHVHKHLEEGEGDGAKSTEQTTDGRESEKGNLDKDSLDSGTNSSQQDGYSVSYDKDASET